MDFIVVFFRDILDGPLYITIVIINSILICSCIGYLADNYLKRKKAKEDYNNTYATVNNSTAGVSVANTQQQVQVQPQVQQAAQAQVVQPQVAQAASVAQQPTQNQ